MKRIDDGRYAVTVLLPRGEILEYKLNLGSWDAVEKDGKGAERGNRTLKITHDGLMDVDIDVASWSTIVLPDKVDVAPKATFTGDVRVHDKFTSAILGNSRTVIVWLPPGYDDETNRNYPVFYLQDGQNLFDQHTAAFGIEWKADETASRLVLEKKIPPILLVGIYNHKTDRLDEYSFVRDEEQMRGGNGSKYCRFLVEELKPFIDRTYRTKRDRENTAIGGSSLGGLIAIEAALNYPDVFGRCAAISPAIWWANSNVLTIAKSHATAARRCKFWIDMGTKEGLREGELTSAAVGRAEKLAKTLQEDGLVPETDYHLQIVPGGEHKEADWAARFDQVLIYLFGR
jgi:predicted alpha/beta superfamily hydrolase